MVVQLIGKGALKFGSEAGSLSRPGLRSGRFCRLPRIEIAPEVLDLATHFPDLLLSVNHRTSFIGQTSLTLLQSSQASLDIRKSRLDATDQISANRQLARDGFSKTIHRILQGIDLPIHPSYILTYLAQEMQGMTFRLCHVQISQSIGLKYILFSN